MLTLKEIHWLMLSSIQHSSIPVSGNKKRKRRKKNVEVVSNDCTESIEWKGASGMTKDPFHDKLHALLTVPRPMTEDNAARFCQKLLAATKEAGGDVACWKVLVLSMTH